MEFQEPRPLLRWPSALGRWTRQAEKDQPSFETDYSRMCVRARDAPIEYKIFAAFCSWITLAGFLVFPTAFIVSQSNPLGQTTEGQRIVSVVEQLPHWAIPVTCCAIGITGLSSLWFFWRGNYVWLLNEIFWQEPTNPWELSADHACRPSVYHSVVGLSSTMINLKTHGWQVNATITFTLTVIGAYMFLILSATATYWVLLERRRNIPAISRRSGMADRGPDASVSGH